MALLANHFYSPLAVYNYYRTQLLLKSNNLYPQTHEHRRHSHCERPQFGRDSPAVGNRISAGVAQR
jgi:hypothetical protein